MCLNIGTTNYHHFPFGTNGKVVVLGVPILKHFRVYQFLFAISLMLRTCFLMASDWVIAVCCIRLYFKGVWAHHHDFVHFFFISKETTFVTFYLLPG